MDNVWAFCSKPALYSICHALHQIIHKVIHSFRWKITLRGLKIRSKGERLSQVWDSTRAAESVFLPEST